MMNWSFGTGNGRANSESRRTNPFFKFSSHAIDPLLLFSILCLDGIENELGIFRVGIILIHIYYVEYSILDFFLNMREKV